MNSYTVNSISDIYLIQWILLTLHQLLSTMLSHIFAVDLSIIRGPGDISLFYWNNRPGWRYCCRFGHKENTSMTFPLCSSFWCSQALTSAHEADDEAATDRTTYIRDLWLRLYIWLYRSKLKPECKAMFLLSLQKKYGKVVFNKQNYFFKSIFFFTIRVTHSILSI